MKLRRGAAPLRRKIGRHPTATPSTDVHVGPPDGH